MNPAGWRFSKCSLRALFLVVLGLPSARAQQVWRVDGIQFRDVPSAYAVAQPGDVILVSQPSSNLGSLSGKGVRILAAPRGIMLNARCSLISGIPAGQQLVLSGFTIDVTPGSFCVGLLFSSSPGSVVLEACTGWADSQSRGLGALLFVNCADVQIFESIWWGSDAGTNSTGGCASANGMGAYGFSFDGCNATVVRCNLRGGNSGGCPLFCISCLPGNFRGASGIRVDRSRIAIHECLLQGGRGGSGTGGPPAQDGGAVDLFNGSEVWITPTPTPALIGDASSVVHCFGAPPTLIGALQAVSESRALPRFEASLPGTNLNLRASWSIPGAPFYFGASLASGFTPLDPSGALGLLEMDYATSRSLLLGTGTFDASGSFLLSLPIPLVTLQSLPFQDFRLQLLTLDATGRIAVSGVDFLLFPG